MFALFLNRVFDLKDGEYVLNKLQMNARSVIDTDTAMADDREARKRRVAGLKFDAVTDGDPQIGKNGRAGLANILGNGLLGRDRAKLIVKLI